MGSKYAGKICKPPFFSGNSEEMDGVLAEVSVQQRQQQRNQTVRAGISVSMASELYC